MGTVKKFKTPGGRSGYEARDSWTDAATGERLWKKRRFPVRPGQTLTAAKEEAEAWLAKRMSDRAQGVVWEPSRESFGALLDRWAASLGAPLAGNTVVAYRSQVRNRFPDDVRGWRVGDITPAQVRGLIRRWEREGLASDTIYVARHVLRSVIALAIDERGILTDPTKGLRLARSARTPVVTWAPEQVETFLAQTQDDELGFAWALLFSTAIRIGELASLQWSDLTGNKLKVSRTWGVDESGKSVVVPRTKTFAVRVIPIPPHIVTLLSQVRASRPAGDVWIVSRDGEPMKPYDVRYHWERAVAESGLPIITPHGARHTGATTMIAAGIPVPVVQRILGHADPSMTMRRYVHPGEDDAEQAMATLAALYQGETSLSRARSVPKIAPMVKKSQ